MKDFFAGKKVTLLTEEEDTKGMKIWHMELEEKEMKHNIARMEDGVVFLHVVRGSMECQVDQFQEEIKEGEGFFINKGNAYRFKECSKEGVEFYVFQLEPSYVEADEVITRKYVEPVLENEMLFYLKFQKEQAAVQVLEDLGALVELKEEGYELRLRSLALELWSCLYEEVGEDTSSLKKADVREKAKLCQMLEFLHSHYREKITLGELAERAGISTGEYCRFFKKKMERTPFEYLQAYRVIQSLPEILEKTDTISRIALSHGFTGSSYFTETFKKEMGCAPGDYRKWYKGEMEECPLRAEEKKKSTKVVEEEAAGEEHVSIRRTSMPAHLL